MSLKIKSLEEHSRPNFFDEVRVKEMGNVVEVMYSERTNRKIFIKKTYLLERFYEQFSYAKKLKL